MDSDGYYNNIHMFILDQSTFVLTVKLDYFDEVVNH